MLRPELKSARASGRDAAARLAEAASLAGSIGLTVVWAEVARLAQIKPATLFGGGLVETVAAVVKEQAVEVAVIDAPVTPVQQRNLEKAWNCKVIDRTGLILEIFGARARTREGALQVELAALTYQRSRLVRSWTHLERQRGGFGFLGGPGETQLETDRRLIGERMARLARDLEGVKATRALHRKARTRVPYPVVALVGYTNAGKSTLFNRLTGAGVFAKDLLFATLDPTMRRIALPSGMTAILSDTVGFVSDLPTDLVAAFRATLEEVINAELIVHVRDVAHPETETQRNDVIAVLRQLGLGERLDRDVIEVLNKIDLLDEAGRAAIQEQAARQPNAVALSAVGGEGCDALLALIDGKFRSARQVVDVSIGLADGASIAWLYSHGEVLERRDDDSHAYLRVSLNPADRARFDDRRRRQAQAPAE